jgi:bifunctional DNA-binding transcriptional regulator/antitoxin component of YhaV-PrlF toxin-antitoxin module
MPKHVVESLKWKGGDMLEIGLDDSRMIVKKKGKTNA